jgi:hypothetical protein
MVQHNNNHFIPRNKPIKETLDCSSAIREKLNKNLIYIVSLCYFILSLIAYDIIAKVSFSSPHDNRRRLIGSNIYRSPGFFHQT